MTGNSSAVARNSQILKAISFVHSKCYDILAGSFTQPYLIELPENPHSEVKNTFATGF
jgi:hypothetical protein